MTMRPPAAGARRSVPRDPTDEQRERLRFLLEDPETWVLRYGWERFLMRGDHATLVPTSDLTNDQRAAAVAWLRQQRHRLYLALEGGTSAPDGWIEEFPLMARLLEEGPTPLSRSTTG